MSKPRVCEHVKNGKRKEHALGHCRICYDRAIRVTDKKGVEQVLYCPQDFQLAYHESNTPNLLALGTRGTGKSTMMRWDAIIRCMLYPGFKALIIRRKLTDLRKSHLKFIGAEMRKLGCGHFRESSTYNDVKFDNGSHIQFSHCETNAALDDYLSSEYDLLVIDELSTFSLDQFQKIQGAVRTTTDKPYIGLVRAGSNWLGPGAAWMAEWFVDKTVNRNDYPDYLPEEFETQFSTLDQNIYIQQSYVNRLKNTPEHVRRAWLYGERVIEGAYFSDFKPGKHCIAALPTWRSESLTSQTWLNIYRSIDWGYDPDPCVVMWHVVFPNGHKITFRERKWLRTLAPDVAKEVKALSSGMKIVDTFADPSMFVSRGDSPYSIADLFEMNGVPLTPSQANRELYGYALHEILNREIDGHPEWQIVAPECPNLVRTLPLMQMDATDPRKIAHGEDHYVECAAYFAIGKASASRDPQTANRPAWMLPKAMHRRALVQLMR